MRHPGCIRTTTLPKAPRARCSQACGTSWKPYSAATTGTRVAAADRHRFVGYARDTGPHPWQFNGEDGRLHTFDPPSRVSFSCNSLEANKLAAVAGMGLTRLPIWLAADAVAAGRLVRVFEEPVLYGYALQAVWPQSRALPLKTRAAIELLAQRLPQRLEPRPEPRVERAAAARP